jgi:two-component system response regulator HydG
LIRTPACDCVDGRALANRTAFHIFPLPAMTTQHLPPTPFINRIIDSMADGLFTMDKSGRITSWNRAMERVSGYSSAEAIGQTCALLQCSRCFGKECPANLRRCKIFEKEYSEAKECRLRHKNGHDVPIIKNASIVRDDQGAVLGIVETVTDLSELNRARRQANEAAARLRELHRLDNIIGKSAPMQQLFRAIDAAAGSDATVLIQGESGTGKELAAGAIHYRSSRRDKPLVTVNCSALSETLLESELFGHVKGAYTGALRDRIGRFEEGAGGTVFLDEIGELSPVIQIKLLRVLQERTVERVGESRSRSIDIRVIAATHRDLREAVRDGRFREDLYYRLKVFPISLPPLRERTEDIPLLINHFIARLNQKTGKTIVDVSNHGLRILMNHYWPGNVRELENALEHGFVLAAGDRIEYDDLPLDIRSATHLPEPSRASTHAPLKLDKESLVELLSQCDWNKAEVARRVGLSRTAIWKHMKKHAIPLTRPAENQPS